eukprot:16160203-Heterocapsa_arctica.AAC.1
MERPRISKYQALYIQGETQRFRGKAGLDVQRSRRARAGLPRRRRDGQRSFATARQRPACCAVRLLRTSHVFAGLHVSSRVASVPCGHVRRGIYLFSVEKLQVLTAAGCGCAPQVYLYDPKAEESATLTEISSQAFAANADLISTAKVVLDTR